MWFEEVRELLVSDRVQQTQVINSPFQEGDELVSKIPDDLIPLLQLAALYRLEITRLEEQESVALRKDHEMRLRMQVLTYQTMIDALASVFHCSLLAHFVKTGVTGSVYQVMVPSAYEIRDGWLVVIPKNDQPRQH